MPEIIEDDYDFKVNEYGSIQYFLLLNPDITTEDMEEVEDFLQKENKNLKL